MRMEGGGVIWRLEALYVVCSPAGDEASGSEGVSLRHRLSSFALGMAWRSGMRKLPQYS